jgi:hypothetical protein
MLAREIFWDQMFPELNVVSADVLLEAICDCFVHIDGNAQSRAFVPGYWFVFFHPLQHEASASQNNRNGIG